MSIGRAWTTGFCLAPGGAAGPVLPGEPATVFASARGRGFAVERPARTGHASVDGRAMTAGEALLFRGDQRFKFDGAAPWRSAIAGTGGGVHPPALIPA